MDKFVLNYLSACFSGIFNKKLSTLVVDSVWINIIRIKSKKIGHTKLMVYPIIIILAIS